MQNTQNELRMLDYLITPSKLDVLKQLVDLVFEHICVCVVVFRDLYCAASAKVNQLDMRARIAVLLMVLNRNNMYLFMTGVPIQDV
jgi:hypothetical protein